MPLDWLAVKERLDHDGLIGPAADQRVPHQPGQAPQAGRKLGREARQRASKRHVFGATRPERRRERLGSADATADVLQEGADGSDAVAPRQPVHEQRALVVCQAHPDLGAGAAEYGGRSLTLAIGFPPHGQVPAASACPPSKGAARPWSATYPILDMPRSREIDGGDTQVGRCAGAGPARTLIVSHGRRATSVSHHSTNATRKEHE